MTVEFDDEYDEKADEYIIERKTYDDYGNHDGWEPYTIPQTDYEKAAEIRQEREDIGCEDPDDFETPLVVLGGSTKEEVRETISAWDNFMPNYDNYRVIPVIEGEKQSPESVFDEDDEDD
jgi:hypothetical protein